MPRATPPPTFDYEAQIRDGGVRHALEAYEAQVLASFDDLQRQVDAGLAGGVVTYTGGARDFYGWPSTDVADGARRVFFNGSGAPVRFVRESSSAPVGSRFLMPASVQWLGVNGSATLHYSTALGGHWIIDAVEPGQPIVEPFVASEFTGWLPAGLEVNQFVQQGCVVQYLMRADVGNVPAATFVLSKKLPGGFSVAVLNNVGMAQLQAGTVYGLGVVYSSPPTGLDIYRPDITQHPAGATLVRVQATFQVV